MLDLPINAARLRGQFELAEIAIVQPKIIVVMGAEALAALGELDIPLARPLEARMGELQQLTPTIDALYVPNIDESLDD